MTGQLEHTQSIKNLLQEGGTYVGVPFGVSMWPMLRNKRDTIVVEPLVAGEELQVGDVAVFVRGQDLVLHRIVAVRPGGYLFWGDNCVAADGVIGRDRVIGKLTGFFRDAKPMDMDSAGYRVYVTAWGALRPGRCMWKRVRAKAGAAARKVGLSR